jgi:hypothetical protein
MPLPGQYEVLVSGLVANAPEGDETVNKQSSWVAWLEGHKKAAVACLRYHVGADDLTTAQSNVFKVKWSETVSDHILDPIDTCLGRTPTGLQCSKKAITSSGLCSLHKGQTLLGEMEQDAGCANEAPCQVCHNRFDEEDAVQCAMCSQGVHGDCWNGLYTGFKLEPPNMKDVDAVLCGLCATYRPYEFQILWEAGKESPPYATVHLMPPTEEQIAAAPWIEECWKMLNDEVNSEAATPEYLVAARPKSKARKQRVPGGFRKITTPAKPPPAKKKTAKKQLFQVGESDSDSDVSTKETASERSESPPPQRGREDRSWKAAFKMIEARLNNLQYGAPAQSGEIDEEYDLSRTRDMISGAACGAKYGFPGSMADKYQCAHEPYTGMPMESWGKKLVRTVMGQDDVQGTRTLSGATPESTSEQQIVTLEDGNVKLGPSKYTVPNRQVLSQWMDGRADQLQSALSSDEDEFAEGGSRILLHAVQLSLGRYCYMGELFKLLVDIERVPWPAAWRYAERFNMQNFQGSINTGTDLSKQLVAAMRTTRVSRRNGMISNLVRGSRDLHMLNTAVADHQAALKIAVPVDRGDRAAQNVVAKRKPAEGIPRNPVGGKCPLCLSTSHVYKAGHYGHTDVATITQACAKTQPDGAACGLVHAFSGPLGTDCRILPAHVHH